MSILLSIGSTTVVLHPDLYWADEFSWHPVQQSVERSVTGAAVIDVATMTGGRPITLQPLVRESAWMTRSAIVQLQAWAAIPGQLMTLELRGVVRTVMWRHQDAPAVSAEPVAHAHDADPGDYYSATLKLMEV